MGSRALLAAVATAVLVGGPAAAGDRDAASIDRGRRLLERHCGGCHAVGRTGGSPYPSAPPLRELNRRYEPEALDEALAEGIMTGHPAMPAFRFEPQDVRSIILYLDSIQDRPRAPTGDGS